MPIVKVADAEEALRPANDSKYGLAATIRPATASEASGRARARTCGPGPCWPPARSVESTDRPTV
ncbi:hypothetical protein [Nocardia yamanashiensis]|uniref:hypothetical protein n=1 Tax=Nocardia yamanashiensis TaxID=209247 RepID=UPI00350E4824